MHCALVKLFTINLRSVSLTICRVGRQSNDCRNGTGVDVVRSLVWMVQRQSTRTFLKRRVFQPWEGSLRGYAHGGADPGTPGLNLENDAQGFLHRTRDAPPCLYGSVGPLLVDTERVSQARCSEQQCLYSVCPITQVFLVFPRHAADVNLEARARRSWLQHLSQAGRVIRTRQSFDNRERLDE